MAARALDCQDVQRLLDDADHGAIAVAVGADRARVDVRRVLAERAEGDALLDLDDRLGQGGRFFLGGAQEVVGETLGALGSDAGQAVQLLDQLGDGSGGA